MKTKNTKAETGRGKKQPRTEAKAIGRKSIEVAAHQLRPAPWNPRPEITSESVADLTASIASVGLIQPIVVMRDPEKPSVKGTDFYLIVAGHRRFRACVDAGLSPIPCELLDVEVERAKRMTFLENLQRRDADPLLESELVKSLIDGGMTQAEIAAETGRGERWVARRANLMNLSDGWRRRVKKGEKFTTDCLEHIAAYPVEIQEKLKDAQGGYYGSTENGATTWSGIKWQFERESCNLNSAPFSTKQCLGCTSNTGCCPDLFDLDGGQNAKLGHCLYEKCWREKYEAHVAETVARAEKKGVEVVKGKPNWGGWYLSDRKDKDHPTLYVYTDGGTKVVKWAPAPKKPSEEDKEAKKAERAAAKAARQKEQRLDHARGKVRDTLEARLADGGIESLKADRRAFDKLATMRLEQDLKNEIYGWSDSFVDDYARAFGIDGVEMDEDLKAEYLKEIAAKQRAKTARAQRL